MNHVRKINVLRRSVNGTILRSTALQRAFTHARRQMHFVKGRNAFHKITARAVKGDRLIQIPVSFRFVGSDYSVGDVTLYTCTVHVRDTSFVPLVAVNSVLGSNTD